MSVQALVYYTYKRTLSAARSHHASSSTSRIHTTRTAVASGSAEKRLSGWLTDVQIHFGPWTAKSRQTGWWGLSPFRVLDAYEPRAKDSLPPT
jgi:Tfp pilus tip-associated adhesin PilY1